jgi:hypothetical protein
MRLLAMHSIPPWQAEISIIKRHCGVTRISENSTPPYAAAQAGMLTKYSFVKKCRRFSATHPSILLVAVVMMIVTELYT